MLSPSASFISLFRQASDTIGRENAWGGVRGAPSLLRHESGVRYSPRALHDGDAVRER